MEKGLHGFLATSLGYLTILLLSTLIPVFIYKKDKVGRIGAFLISILLTIFLINVIFFALALLSGFIGVRSLYHPAFYDFYEVFWIIPPLVVYLYCSYKDKEKYKEKLRLGLKLFCYEHSDPVEMTLKSERLIYTLKIQLRYICSICNKETILLLSDIIETKMRDKRKETVNGTVLLNEKSDDTTEKPK